MKKWRHKSNPNIIIDSPPYLNGKPSIEYEGVELPDNFTIDSQELEIPDWSKFSVQASDSILFGLAESGNQVSLRHLNLLIGLCNNIGLRADTKTLDQDGRLQNRLQALINSIDDVDLSSAIAQFNQILKNTLKVDWYL